MLVSVKKLKYLFGVRPSGVLHVGAHLAEEARAYREENFGHVIWVEAQSELCNHLRETLDPAQNLVLQAAVSDKDGVESPFYLASNSQSSSLHAMGTHRVSYPNIAVSKVQKVVTSRLDSILPLDRPFDFLNLDIQGAEYQAIVGLGHFIENVRWIYVEVNNDEVYEGIKLVSEVDSLLRQSGFSRVLTVWTHANWGDALYVRDFQPFLAIVGKLYVWFGRVRGLLIRKYKKWYRRAGAFSSARTRSNIG